METCPDKEYADLDRTDEKGVKTKEVNTHTGSGSPNMSSSSLNGMIWRIKDMGGGGLSLVGCMAY